jgi:hypothetical protein
LFSYHLAEFSYAGEKKEILMPVWRRYTVRRWGRMRYLGEGAAGCALGGMVFGRCRVASRLPEPGKLNIGEEQRYQRNAARRGKDCLLLNPSLLQNL